MEALPTGFTNLDRALGIGGLPRGRISEIFGPAACGKTALALQCVASLQRCGGAAAWIDAEHTFDADFAVQLGVDLAALPVAEPESAEEAMEIARRFVASAALDLVIVDSAAALVPRLELQASIEGQGGTLQARVLASELRKLARITARSAACVLFLNQTRVRAEATPGELETSAAGPSLKLYAAVRIALAARRRAVRFRVLKNQLAAAFATGEWEWWPGLGFAERP